MTRALGQIVAKDDGTVVKSVMSAEEKRHRAALSGLQDRCPGTGVRVELRLVPVTELLPPLNPVTKPLPQLGARRDILQPRVGGERVLLHAPRPLPLDEDAATISTRWGLVRAFDLDHAW